MHPLTRQSRHPVMVGEMTFIAAVSVLQILGGEVRHETLWHLPQNTYILLALVNLIGCVCCLSATVQSDAWTAAAFELTGSLVLTGSLSVYLYSVFSTAQYPDTDIVTALLAGLISGIVTRIYLISKSAWDVVKERSAPPVGDMDLVTADSVNSVAALIAETHGGGGTIQREAGEFEIAPAKHRQEI